MSRLTPEPRPEPGFDLIPSEALQAKAAEMFPAILPESQSSFESRTGEAVNQKITAAVDALEEALRCMRADSPHGGHTSIYCELSENGQAMEKTPTFERLMLLRWVLKDLQGCTQPIVTSRL
ncbi:hypothetical protein [Oceanospirillum beijerinckii]|uniref:hypothetical protein n=1 Tax=Oceanospirillum beijerinckii TaxID=64976 RepID=UPI00042A4516|nr:hypothetical protein [Oceanospirillum beijerinckii]